MSSSVACGGGGGGTPPTPTVPTPQPNPPASQAWALSGTVVDAVTGAPVQGAALAFPNSQTQSAADGAWSISGTGSAAQRQAVTVTAAGYLTYETGVRWDQAGRNGIQLRVIPERAPFSLSFYRELVRNGFEEPSTLRNVARWQTNPNFYINTFNPKTGQPLDAAELALVEQSIRESVPQLTGGQFSAGVFESGNGARDPRRDYINVKFVYEPKETYCGRAFVGANPGEITINYDRCAVSCGSLKVTPIAIAHEVGHAMGFWHISRPGIMAPILAGRCGSVSFTSDELLHAKIAYSRPAGNADVDRDPASSSNLSPAEAGGLVICPR